MTIDQAINILKARSKFVADVNLDAKIAYRMAIEALERQRVEDEEMYRRPMGDQYIDSF